jgi:pyrroline-5-carboxylate reductase
MLKVGILGLGNMGYAIYNGLKVKTQILAFDIEQKYEEVNWVESAGELISKSDIIILCVKPNQVEESCREIPENKVVLSIAAGISLSKLKIYLSDKTKIARLMPNLPLQVGVGAIGFVTNHNFVDDIVYSLFQDFSLIIKVKDEDQMDAITGLSGSGPAFVFSFLHAMAEGGVKCGLSYKDSLALSVQTMMGSCEYLKQVDIHPSELRDRVASPGGTTIHGLYSLEKNGFHHAIMDAVFSAYQRSKELGKNQ